MNLPLGTSKTVGSVLRGFKIGVTKWIRQNTHIREVWQRNYYEHIVRNEKELNLICVYINNNPLKWELDRENLNRLSCSDNTLTCTNFSWEMM